MGEISGLDRRLAEAVSDGNVPACVELIAHGASANAADAFGDPCSCIAIDNGSGKMLRLLLESNADPNVKDRFGDACLVKAIDAEDTSMARALLGAGADANVKDRFGDPCLAKAIDAEALLMVQVLLRNGADPAAKDRFGEACLDKAASLGGAMLEVFKDAKTVVDVPALPGDSEPQVETLAERLAIARAELSQASLVVHAKKSGAGPKR